MSKNDDGPGGAHSAGAGNDEHLGRQTIRHRRDQRSAEHPLEVTFVALAPSAGRKRPAWVVPSCRYCFGAHLHRGLPGLRRAPCGGGIYWIGPMS